MQCACWVPSGREAALPGRVLRQRGCSVTSDVCGESALLSRGSVGAGLPSPGLDAHLTKLKCAAVSIETSCGYAAGPNRCEDVFGGLQPVMEGQLPWCASLRCLCCRHWRQWLLPGGGGHPQLQLPRQVAAAGGFDPHFLAGFVSAGAVMYIFVLGLTPEPCLMSQCVSADSGQA